MTDIALSFKIVINHLILSLILMKLSTLTLKCDFAKNTEIKNDFPFLDHLSLKNIETKYALFEDFRVSNLTSTIFSCLIGLV